jgi:type II secretory pathway pseudopilin PulG
MTETTPDNSTQRKKSGRRWIIIILGSLIVIALLIKLAGFMIFLDSEKKQANRQARVTIKDLELAIISFQVEYNRYPISTSALSGPDISMRSRGPMLPMLIGDETIPLNAPTSNPKEIKFIDLSKAHNRRSGTWQDGSEWVLSDPWGEPYYIVMDTSGDGKIANPEFGADQSDAEYAKRCRVNPPTATLPLKVLIYSSGPDRDSKTWNDNICSWWSW